jgi:hypothetical protein
MIQSLTSKHALRRFSQRGIAQEIVNCVLIHGDLETPSRGCTRLRMSSRKVRELMADDEASPACLRKAERLTLVVANDDAIVTAYWSDPRTHGAPTSTSANFDGGL